jgi:hypothetical protein
MNPINVILSYVKETKNMYVYGNEARGYTQYFPKSEIGPNPPKQIIMNLCAE